MGVAIINDFFSDSDPDPVQWILLIKNRYLGHLSRDKLQLIITIDSELSTRRFIAFGFRECLLSLEVVSSLTHVGTPTLSFFLTMTLSIAF